MVRDERGAFDSPEPESVFDTFDDSVCREILDVIDEPMSAREVSEATGIPVSTTYKKLDKLQEASLVSKETQIDPGGHHRARFVADFDRVIIERGEGGLAVNIESRMAKAEQQLVDMWATVREQT